ncbi:MAG: PH domain-containing protein [Bacteroidetes bacterium]|nr:PH domain-containing protein [Bacteroidota bacterium]
MRTKLKNNETVAIIIRPHWFTLVLPSVIAVIGLAIGIAIGTYGPGYGYFLTLIPLGYLGYKVIERNNNLWAVTNLRVIDEYGVISLNSKESPLDKINNVTYEQSIWGRMFGYGNVQIQTAAEVGSTVYYQVERPKELKDTITQMQEEYKRSQIMSQAQELAKAISHTANKPSQSDVAAEIEKLFELKQRGILTEEEFMERKRKLLS